VNDMKNYLMLLLKEGLQFNAACTNFKPSIPNLSNRTRTSDLAPDMCAELYIYMDIWIQNKIF
jgi:hypothetical protein